MTRALVTQLVEALEYAFTGNRRPEILGAAITAAREYLATEPSSERAELIEKLRWAGSVGGNQTCIQAADMLEADADLRTQLARRTVERDMAISMAISMLEADAQQAKRVPMTGEAHKTLLDMAANIEKFSDGTESDEQLSSECIRFILERVDHHGITPTEKSTDWGQP